MLNGSFTFRLSEPSGERAFGVWSKYLLGIPLTEVGSDPGQWRLDYPSTQVEFEERFGTEAQCRAYLEKTR